MRDLGHRRAELACYINEDVNHAQSLLIECFRQRCAATRLCLRSVRARVLAAQQASFQWGKRRDAQSEFARHRDQLSLQQRVLNLQRDEPRPAAKAGSHVRLGDLPCRRVGETKVAHLACGDEIVERAHRLLDGRKPVPAMQPVQINVVSLETPERVLASSSDGLATGAAVVGITLVQVGKELRGDDDAVTACRVTANMIADDFLRVTARVHVRGVDEVAVAIEKPIDDLL